MEKITHILLFYKYYYVDKIKKTVDNDRYDMRWTRETRAQLFGMKKGKRL
jgi:hypothetical protein